MELEIIDVLIGGNNMNIFKLLDTIVFIYCLIMMCVNKENVNSLVFFGIIAMIQTMIMISWRL